MLTALNNFRLSNISQTTEQLENTVQELNGVKALFPTNDKQVIEILGSIITCFINLCNWVQASVNCDGQADKFLKAAQAKATITLEDLPSNSFEIFSQAVQEIIGLVKNTNTVEQLSSIANKIQLIPVPIFQIVEEDSYHSRSSSTFTRNDSTVEDPFIVKVMLEIDRKPWATPQVIQASAIYDLTAKITVPNWPVGTDFFLIDYISTLPREHYRLSQLQIPYPDIQPVFEFTVSGHAEFPVAQSILSEPIVIRTRGTFISSQESSSKRVPATIVGYHQLRLKVSDKTRTPLLSRYNSIDARNLEIIEEIDHTIPNLPQNHRMDFIEAIGAITNYMGINLQQALYRGNTDIREADFQEKLLYHMRTLLGENVQEAPKQGGGPTDIQYKTITIELKVEKTITNRRDMINKYLGQPTQYSSSHGSQLGILCILDLTQKDNPPSNPQNQITLETPRTHGFQDGNSLFPTKICAIIIDGNLRLPSSYSR